MLSGRLILDRRIWKIQHLAVVGNLSRLHMKHRDADILLTLLYPKILAARL